MDNKNMNIPDLIRKYEQMRYMNKKFYFTADEFEIIANHYIKDLNNPQALSAIDLAMSIHPHSPELMMAKAKVLIATEKYDEAYNYLLTIAQDETSVDLLLLKFECLIKLNRTEEANAYLTYILGGELNEKDHYIFINKLAFLYNNEEGFETAIMLLEKAREIDNTNFDVLIELAYAYEMNDNIDKAIEITNAMIDLNPYSFESWVSLGR
ncbi:MAG: hypothetical protein GX857_09000, partial [Bacteroidales bacterium]|nr:hypothetical protein [Bacteroidales bacterium]